MENTCNGHTCGNTRGLSKYSEDHRTTTFNLGRWCDSNSADTEQQHHWQINSSDFMRMRPQLLVIFRSSAALRKHQGHLVTFRTFLMLPTHCFNSHSYCCCCCCCSKHHWRGGPSSSQADTSCREHALFNRNKHFVKQTGRTWQM